MSKKYKTAKPVITDAQLARIRAAAHRYMLAGGSIVLDANDAANRDEHIATVREMLTPHAEPTFARVLERVLPSGPDHLDTHQGHEALFDAAWHLVNADSEAGFMFGLCVGLELAALTFCQLATVPTIRAPRVRKGSRR